MVHGHLDHTATLLTDGRVLIAGGVDESGENAAYAELFDPASGTFSATGSMTHIRIDHTATLLTDGRVLIAGGRSFTGATTSDYSPVPEVRWLASAELYDPTTGKFSATGSMAEARFGQTATLLRDGRVLIAGGYGAAGSVASAELYDPATGTFSPTGSMATGRSGHTATLLSDGRVLIAGGLGLPGSAASAELYDPATGKFSLTGSMTSAPLFDTGTLLQDGRVLIAGGSDGSAELASAELYDPATGKFSPTGSMTSGRHSHTATLLLKGRVLITGGYDNQSAELLYDSAELYDPATGTFSSAGSMTHGRGGHTATLLSDGRVLIAGGLDVNGAGAGAGLNSAELYQP